MPINENSPVWAERENKMNIEIANRLVNLRKANNFSQEALAEKLGISRQAVSKWERAEASPDTDNLILLSRLYGISIDELLKTDDEIPGPEVEEWDKNELTVNESYTEQNSYSRGDAADSGQNYYNDDASDSNEEYVHIGLIKGIHVKDKDGEVHVGWDGIHVVDNTGKGDNVNIDKIGVYVNGKRYDKEWFAHRHHSRFPMGWVIIALYLVIGIFWGAWHPGWLLFLLIPIWDSIVEAIYHKNLRCFAYPVFAALVFLCLGIFGSLWNPGWVVFLTIPLFYSIVGRRRDKAKEDDYNEQ
ncbi:MAG: helix-turn-helix domain-containing protein [Butyrivibrio sp.]|nr:helix-turn-helix domain-containing protein [Butyrivibrio sp.]